MKVQYYSALTILMAICFSSDAWKRSADLSKSPYKVGLRSLPNKVDPWLSQINSDHLINLNLYYPLISRDKMTGALSSNFLDLQMTNSKSRDFKVFSLCLKDAIRFSDNTTIESSDLKADLDQFHANQEIAPELESTSTSGRCVVVKLKKTTPNYLENLTGTASTILKRSTVGTALPIGTGPYKVTNLSDESIRLERVSQMPEGVNRVEFVRVDNFEEARQKQITDFNYIFSGKQLPDNLLSGYRKMDVMALKSYALVLAVKDDSIRKSLSSCINSSVISKITGFNLAPIPGFLPKGILGYQAETRKADLSRCRFANQKIEVPFYNYNPDITDALKHYFSENSYRFPVKVRVEEHLPQETVEAAFGKKEMLAIVGFDGSGSQAGDSGEAAVYFESFFRNERIIPVPVQGLKSAIKKALHADNFLKKSHYYEVAHELLLRSGYIVPLGQLKLEQYYPSTISNIIWGDQIGGYPEYALMRRDG
jgi:hypothetical protein